MTIEIKTPLASEQGHWYERKDWRTRLRSANDQQRRDASDQSHRCSQTGSRRLRTLLQIVAMEPQRPNIYVVRCDRTNRPEFGLIAEEVAEVNPALVVRNDNVEIFTVRYEAVNAMLLNEFIKAHRRIEEQDKRIDQLTSQLKQQAAQVQRVSAQLELSKSAPQTVLNDH